jgi:hypothetical protein
MDMVLLDWTRMGKAYCLAGVVTQDGARRVVRPLPAKNKDAAARNLGWSAYLLDGHKRWEVFELVGAEPAGPEPPHTEDVWVRTLRPRGAFAPPQDRRDILAATTAPPGESPFGVELGTTRTAAYVAPGTGVRSLATVAAPSQPITFNAFHQEGMAGPEFRVMLPLPGLEGRPLPLKDHHLLQKAEKVSRSLDTQIKALQQAVRQMGETVAVRLGLSRPYPPNTARGPGNCWLMVDGFFSPTEPQP